MCVENEFRKLEVLHINPHQNVEDVKNNVIQMKLEHSGAKGITAETVIGFLIQIPGVTRVEPLHEFVGDLDADLVCHIEKIEPIYVQVKTSETDAGKFKDKIRRRRERGQNLRFVSLSFDTPFDKIIEDFVEQVNKLESKKILKPIKFSHERPRKRKSYWV